MADNKSVKAENESNGTDWPLTTQDLYGPSKEDEAPLVYEETPIIEPIVEDVNKPIDSTIREDSHVHPPSQEPTPVTYTIHPQPFKRVRSEKSNSMLSGFGRTLINVFLMVLLFGLGFGASIFLKNSFSDLTLPEIRLPSLALPSFSRPSPSVSTVPPTAGITPLPTDSIRETPGETVAPKPTLIPTGKVSAGPKTYFVLSGTARQPVTDIRYTLPDSVKDPVCNQAACSSQGTNLPGGTRFTVAPRGSGYALPDPAGYQLTDASGRKFTLTETTIAGYPATEYKADFAGTTLGGYGFSKMRGVMVKINDTLTIELNHFSPSGKSADFESDDKEFDRIISSLTSKSGE